MGRRVTIDLTDEAEAEVDRLCELHSITQARLFRIALSLVRIHSDAENEGKEVVIQVPWKTEHGGQER